MKKSIRQRVWLNIKNKDVGTNVNAKTIANQLKIPDRGDAVVTALHNMRTDGCLDGTDTVGRFKITPKTEDWGNHIRFISVASKKKKLVKKRTVADNFRLRHSNPVIDTLLNAMAEAEDELNRLVALDEKVRELTNT